MRSRESSLLGEQFLDHGSTEVKRATDKGRINKNKVLEGKNKKQQQQGRHKRSRKGKEQTDPPAKSQSKARPMGHGSNPTKVS